MELPDRYSGQDGCCHPGCHRLAPSQPWPTHHVTGEAAPCNAGRCCAAGACTWCYQFSVCCDLCKWLRSPTLLTQPQAQIQQLQAMFNNWASYFNMTFSPLQVGVGRKGGEGCAVCGLSRCCRVLHKEGRERGQGDSSSLSSVCCRSVRGWTGKRVMQAPQKSCRSAALQEGGERESGCRGCRSGYCGSQERGSQAAYLPIMVLKGRRQNRTRPSTRCRS